MALPSAPTILIVGASRGLGLAMAGEFLVRGWNVIGTVRGAAQTGLAELASAHSGLEIESLDVDAPDQIAALRERLAERRLDMLFVNAGIANHEPDKPVGEVVTDDFVRVMVTNVLGPMRVIEALQHLVPAGGLIGAMSSGQGSVANNETGLHEVYRASKAALNMSMRSFAARQAGTGRALLLLAPGWIRTGLGGDQAPYSVEESMPILADLMIGRLGTDGLRYLDRFGHDVPW